MGFLQPTLHRSSPSLPGRIKSEAAEVICISETINPNCLHFSYSEPPKAFILSPQPTSGLLATWVHPSFLHCPPLSNLGSTFLLKENA